MTPRKGIFYMPYEPTQHGSTSEASESDAPLNRPNRERSDAITGRPLPWEVTGRGVRTPSPGQTPLPAPGTQQPPQDIEMQPVNVPANVPQPEPVRPVRPAATLQALERVQGAIQASRERDVQPDVAAELVNRLRRFGPGAGQGGAERAATNAELMQGITDADVRQWYEAQGITQRGVDALRSSALRSGLPNPTGTFLNNAMQFIAAPWVGYKHGAWASAGMGLATAVAAAPMNAAQQSAVVTVCESIREHGGPVIVPDKNNINDRHYLPQLSETLQRHVQQFSDLHDRLVATAQRLNVDPAQHGQPDFQAALARLAPNDLTQLREHAQELLHAEERLHGAQREFMMTQGAHERQWMGNRFQAAPRTLRAPAAGGLSMLAKTGAKWISPTAQTVASLVLTAGQHVAAGFDERAKQDYNNKLNLLYGDFFTEAGNDKLDRGEPLEPNDIDPAKLRNFVQVPAQSAAKHVANGLNALIAEMEAGPMTDAQDAAAAMMRADRNALRAGRVTDLHPGGVAEALLLGSEGKVFSQQLWNDVRAKYTLREWSAQTSQRIGQMFHVGVFGSAASSVMGKVASAVVGGAKEASFQQTASISGVSGGMALIGALNQHTAIAVKNNRREADPDIGLLRQTGRGIAGGIQEFRSQRSGTQASRHMNQLLSTDTIDHSLQFARTLQQRLGEMPLPETTPLPMTLGQASTSLTPGHVTPPGYGHVSISMPSSAPGPSGT